MSVNQTSKTGQACRHDSCATLGRLGVLLIFLGLAMPLAQAQTITATVDPTTVLVTNYEGWGTSLCWWANVCGGYANRTNYCQLAYTTLKLNIVRYNIGGGENPGIPDTLQFRARMPGFEPTNGVWNWNADANQRWVLREAVALGANHVEAFANSPPWWMTVSGSVTGCTNDPHADNLQTAYETNFAAYLATVVSNLTVLDGIKFELVTPMNEPEGPWGYGGGQEGCHMDSGQQARMVNDLSAALSAQKLSTGIDAPETYAEGDAATAINAYGSAQNNVTLITSHAYGTKNPASLGGIAASLGKPAWLAEYGDGDGTGLTTARRIHDDITGAGVCAWNYWQLVDNGSGWGLLYNPLDGSGTTNYTINKKFYAFGQFSQFVRPGCQIINVNDNYSLAAYNPANQTLVIVALNDTTGGLTMNYNLSGFTGLPATVPSVRTSSTENQAAQPAISLVNKTFSTTLISSSVTTFILTNVVTAPLPAPAGLAAVPGNAQVALSWNAVTGATNYVVLRGTSSGNETFIASLAGTFYADTGLRNGTNYFYVVYATGPAGSSVNSAEAGATPFSGPPAVYWTNAITAAAQDWNSNLNWTNAAAFPNATQSVAVINSAITANQIINLNQTNAIGGLSLGAAGGSYDLAGNGGALTFDNTPGRASLTQLAASSGDTLSTPIFLNTGLNVSNLSVNALTVSGGIAGTNALNFLGSGSLTLSASNSFSGVTTISAGSIKLSNQSALQNSSVALNGGTLGFDSSVAGRAFSLGALATGANGAGNNLALQNNAATALTLTLGYNDTDAIYAGTLSGGGSLIKTGTGMQTIGSGTSGGASYTGATTILNGTLTFGGGGNMMTTGTLDISGNSGACAMNVADAAAVSTTGGILIADGAGNGYPGTGTLTVKNNASLSAASLTFGGNNAGRVPNGSFVTVQDNGSFTLAGSFDINRTKGGSTAENDALNLNGGILTAGNFLDSASTGNVGNTHQATINFNGGLLKANANDPAGSTFLPAFAAGYLTVNVQAGGAIINPNGYSITIAASLNHGGGSPDGGLTLLGGGTLMLTGPNTYNGGTDLAGGILDFSAGALGTGGVTFDSGALQWAIGNTDDISLQTVTVNPGGGTLDVNGNTVVLAGSIGGDGALTLKSTIAHGVLILNGTNSCTGLTVANGGTLAGTGIISGAVTVQNGGALSPGNPLGTLTISNNLTLDSDSTTFVRLQHSPPASDAVKILGTLTEAGTLVATNIGAGNFTGGDSFKLFNAANNSGAFANFILPSLTTNLVWNTSMLGTAGILSVVALTSPTIGNAKLTGGNLMISGSGGPPNLNYYLLSTTNLSAPVTQWTRITTNQFDAGGNFNFTNLFNANLPQNFYLLQVP